MMDDKDLDILFNNREIPDAEVLQDIYDTEREILLRRRLNHDPEGVKEREDFILKLKRLLELREEIRQ